jgi:hypothetical protein
MRKPAIIFTAGIFAVVFSANPVVANDNTERPCYSIQQAKSRGCFICPVFFAPSSLDWKGQQIAIKEAWLERRTERLPSFNPFAPKFKIVSGYHLCFTLSKG